MIKTIFKFFVMAVVAIVGFASCGGGDDDPLTDSTIPPGPTPSETTPDYFTVEAMTDGTQLTLSEAVISPSSLAAPNLLCSTDGKEWKKVAINTPLPLNKNQKMMFKADEGGNKTFCEDDYGPIKYYHFITQDAGHKINVSGNIMYLLDGENPATEFTKVNKNVFCRLFEGCKGLVSAKDLKLPVTNLRYGDYSEMFDGCSSLTDAPELPATKLSNFCYNYMFSGCSSLTKAPELPATEVSAGAYIGMFKDCKKLESVTLKADVLKLDALENWLKGAGTEATNPTLYVNAPMMENSDVIANKGVFTMAIVQSESTESETLPDYFTVEALTDGARIAMVSKEVSPYSLADPKLLYSTDGKVWKKFVLATFLPLNKNQKVMFKADEGGNKSFCAPTMEVTKYYHFITMDAGHTIKVSGNIMYLLDGENPTTVFTNQNGNAFCRLFEDCKGLVSAKDLKLPVMNISYGSYSFMFSGCSSLIDAPDLPATKLSNFCYSYMFYGCSSLIKAPELPATEVSAGAYSGMFRNCKKLESVTLKADVLKAQALHYWLDGAGTEAVNHPKLNVKAAMVANSDVVEAQGVFSIVSIP